MPAKVTLSYERSFLLQITLHAQHFFRNPYEGKKKKVKVKKEFDVKAKLGL